MCLKLIMLDASTLFYFLIVSNGAVRFENNSLSRCKHIYFLIYCKALCSAGSRVLTLITVPEIEINSGRKFKNKNLPPQPTFEKSAFHSPWANVLWEQISQKAVPLLFGVRLYYFVHEHNFLFPSFSLKPSWEPISTCDLQAPIRTPAVNHCFYNHSYASRHQ